MEYRDYYKILGVERAATAEQIKTAYRRLARKYHPDVSKETNAEARFKEVQEAYEVLKDPEKRAAYDQLGSEWKSGQQFRPPPDWGSGFEFSGAPAGRAGAPPAHAARGAAAGAGDGAGRQLAGGLQRFLLLALRRRAARSPARGARAARDHHARVDIDLEEAFRGTTRTLELKPAARCKPDGIARAAPRTPCGSPSPPASREGQLIRLAGQGEPGRRGRRGRAICTSRCTSCRTGSSRSTGAT